MGLDILQVANKKVDDLFNNSVLIEEDDAEKLNAILENVREKE
ncbi:MAG: hypothetical protein WKG06_17540 [Segetibacter sp.]